MATDKDGPARLNEPEPRQSACSTMVNDELVMHGGWLQSYRGLRQRPPMPHVEVFSADLAKWTQKETTGTLPPPLQGAVCTCINHQIYMYGGWIGYRFSNSLYELHVATLCWQEVHVTNPQDGPMGKMSCGMINTSRTRLCLVGGYGIPSESLQPGSKFVLHKQFKDGRGWSNEIHSFDIPSGLWGVPPTTGQGPPPSAAFTFIRVDLVRAVFFGGYNAEAMTRVADVFLLNLEIWHWTTLLPRGPSQPWPVGRDYHSAFSLYDADTSPTHPCLAVSGGLTGDGTPLREVWVLSIKEEPYWEEIPLPTSFTARFGHTGGVIHRSESRATAVFFGGCPENPAKYASAEDWPCMAQTTVVDLALEPSKAIPGKSTGWTATSCRDSTALAMQVLYNRALRHGFIESRSIVSLLTGAAGSGKTHVKYLLFQKTPPMIRISTPLLESPVRALSFTRVNAEDDEWHEINDDEQCRIIAATLTTGDILTESTAESTLQGTIQTEQPQSSNFPPSSAEPSASHDQTTAAALTDHPSTTIVHNNPSTEHPHLPQSTTISNSTNEPDRKSDDSEVCEELMKLIVTSSGSKKLLQADRIYLFDSGGQHIFHELLRLFLHQESVTIFVTKLNERLDHHPMIEYYGKDGKPLSLAYPSPLSHEDILKHSFRAVQSQVYSEGESLKNSPKLLVVGTHRDKEMPRSESVEEKNEKLKRLLAPAFQKRLIYYGEKMNELIFPVNAKTPGAQDQGVAKVLRKAILSTVSSVKSHKTPLGWHVLEIALRRLAASKQRSILSIQECLQLARKLHLSAEELDAAFEHLSQLNLIFYYRKVLPDTVFIDPQVMIDKVTEFVQYSYTLQCQPNAQLATTGKWLEFRDEGILTVNFLNEFPKHYESDLFTPSDLLHILEHRLIIAHISEEKYFMPSLLLDLPADEVEQYRVKPSSSAAPFVIRFQDNLAPTGIYCSLIASLLSSLNWKFHPHPDNRVSPECVARNCIKFKLPSGLPGAMTLIDSYTHFEVHVEAPEEVCSQLCPNVRSVILQHVVTAAGAHHYSNISPESAFLCESEHPPPSSLVETESQTETVLYPPHAATVVTSASSCWWTCTIDPSRVHGKLEKRHMIWFRDTFAAEATEVVRDTSEALESTTLSQNVDGQLVNPLDEEHHFQVTDYLSPLETDKKQLLILGEILGLRYNKLKGMMDSVSFLGDMIQSWLRREDYVDHKCPPTWGNLVTALRHPRVGQTGIADRILRDI